LIDAPASALNNLGNIPGERYDNSVGVKLIKTREGSFPYVSAQAFRYWLRKTLEESVDGWQSAPIYREEKIAYTDANPIRYWDDDLFGYMRAPSKRESARAKRIADESRAGETETTDTITRAAPFRVSTLVSIAPVTPTNDFGVMSRHDGDPVPHEHQFYRATLKGLFSLDLNACGTFWYRKKTGFRSLDEVRINEAVKANLIHMEREKAYRLQLSDRVKRVAALFEGLAILSGGAKQTLHYTDVMPPVVIFAVTKGGNHIFKYVISANNRGLPELNTEALHEALNIYKDEILSAVYVGWIRGYQDEERQKLDEFVNKTGNNLFKIGHPRETFKALANDLLNPVNASWME